MKFTGYACRRLYAGCALLFVWLVSQSVQITFLPVYDNIELAVSLDEGGFALIAAMWLVVNNALRLILLYSGWFAVSDAASCCFDRPALSWTIPPFAIPVSYFGIAFLNFPSVPHFGVPAVFTLASVLFLKYLTRDVTRPGYKFSILAVVVFSIQWLDLIPELTPYGFGRGELSVAVKTVAEAMGKEHLLNAACGLAFSFSFVIAMLLVKLFVSYEKQLLQLGLIRRRERELTKMRAEQARMRLFQEMQYLVHDLRRPLTTMLGLSDLLSLSKDPQTASHGRAIMDAAEKMDMMIGELKDPDSIRAATAEEIVKYAMSQVRALPWGAVVSVNVPAAAGRRRLSANVIRFSRVLVNLLDNAHRAAGLSEAEPRVSLSVLSEDDGVSFIIDDNGPGFRTPQVGERSTWGSTGIGLAFVKKALERCGGRLSYTELPDGLSCRVFIPAPAERDDEE